MNEKYNEINEMITRLKERLKKLEIEGIDIEGELNVIKMWTPASETLSENDLETAFNTLENIESIIEQKNIYNQIKKSMSHLEEALEYEIDIPSELDAYVAICHLALTKLEDGLSIMTDEMANIIYETIYKILKVQIANGNTTLFDTILKNDNNKKYINELVRKDIEYLTNVSFIKPKELVTLNKAVSRAEVNTKDERRLVDIEVIKAIVDCYNSEERRTLVKETISKRIASVNLNFHNTGTKINGIETMRDNEDKVLTKSTKVSSIKKAKHILASIVAVLTIISASAITVKVNKSEKLTISNYLEMLLPFSGMTAFSTLMLSSHKNSTTSKKLIDELDAIKTSLTSLNSELIKGATNGMNDLEDLKSLEQFMTSTSSYESLTDDERELLEETLSESTKKEYFTSILTKRNYLA